MRNVFLFFAALFCSAASADVILDDDAGRRIELDEPAQRIVTLAPHLAEMIFAAGAGERLFATVEWSDFPPAARELPRIGDGFLVDAERIVALEPDLVLAWGGGTPENTLARLRELGLPVAVLTPRKLESIPRHLEWLGRATGNEAVASDAARDFRKRLAELRDTFAGRESLRVFYQINDPLVFTIGGEHTITEAIETCGGENIFADLPGGAHSIAREEVIARNPEAILIGSHNEDRYESADWQRWHNLAAVQAGNILEIDAPLLARAAPRILEGVEQVCEKLQRARQNLKKPG